MTRIVLIVLLAVGTVVPLAVIVPWLLEHGLDVETFIGELFATPVSAFFAVDVIVSAFVVAVLALSDRTLSAGRRAAVLVATFTIGVSCGLPLWALLRGRSA
jgi:Terpene cyclase DEP1